MPLFVLILLLLSTGCRFFKTEPAKQSTTPAAEVKPKARFPKPQHVRGIYMTAWSAGRADKRNALLDLLDRTELNSVVIDVRDAGRHYFRMNIPLADESGANDVAVTKPQELMDTLEKRGAYPIARIACFRDRLVPKAHPELAVQQAGGGIWKDRGGYTWLDPYNRKNWEYIGQVVDFALDLGFPEIQLDYVRFPSEGRVDAQTFPARASFAAKDVTPTQVITEFADYIRARVKQRGGLLSADIFGIVSVNRGDHGIGQALNTIVAPFDILSPMLYPSHFHKGEYSVADPSSEPYDIVKRSLEDYSMRVPNKKIRPWLQDFQNYTKEQIQAQIKAAKEMGYEEYLMWNAGNHYVEEAYKDNSGLVAKPGGD